MHIRENIFEQSLIRIRSVHINFITYRVLKNKRYVIKLNNNLYLDNRLVKR